MANIVQLKRSSVLNKIPDAANVAVGEPVVNLADKVLYTKNGSNAIIVIGAGTTSNIAEGTNLYYTNARVRSAFTAGDGIILEANGQIVANVTGGGGSSVTVANVAPGSATAGDLYFDNELLTLFVYYDDGDTQQWVEASPSASNNPFEFSQSIAGSATEIYRFDKTLYRGGKFLITINDTTNFKIEEVFVVHDGTDVSVSDSYLQENQALIGTIDVTYTANVVGGNVILYGTANSGAPTAKGEVNLIRI